MSCFDLAHGTHGKTQKGKGIGIVVEANWCAHEFWSLRMIVIFSVSFRVFRGQINRLETVC